MNSTTGKKLIISGVTDLDLASTLDCGQAFRWIEQEDGSFSGVAWDRAVNVKLDGGTLTIEGADESDLAYFRNYFDLDTDYSKIKDILSAHPSLKTAIDYAPGIRILRQNNWEALSTFIITQNNNIKRIKGIVERLCTELGEPLGNGKHAYPTIERLNSATLADLEPLRAGFRARYLLDCAKKVSTGTVDLDVIPKLGTEAARAVLMTILGVGEKVADCALLFGFYRIEYCPMDVWMKRVMAEMLPDGFPDYALPYAGIAQQYLFHYARGNL